MPDKPINLDDVEELIDDVTSPHHQRRVSMVIKAPNGAMLRLLEPQIPQQDISRILNIQAKAIQEFMREERER